MSYEQRRDWGRGRGRGGDGGSSAAASSGGGGHGGRGGGRGRHPSHLKGREIGLWYARKQGQKSKETDRQQRAVVRMDERREEQIVQLLSAVQPRADKEQEAMSWWSGDEEGDTPEQPPKVKPSAEKAEKAPVKRRPILEKTFLDRDVEYLFEKNDQDTELDEQLKEDLRKKKSDPRYIEMQRFREKLPSYGMRQELVNLINNNRVTVISGETGCGKTTQVTQFILDDYIERGKGSTCRIVCTQPRRISAISVAERVAAERAEACGNGKSTGYQIRLQRHLSSISHVVLDEIHERNLQSDVLMSIIKDLLNIRLDLKVILMSATLNAEKFSEYFDNCPMIHIPGFTFPVVEYLLEDVIEKLRYSAGTIDALEMMDDDKVDLDLIAALIRHIVLEEEDGAILVFLPGWDNISTLHDLLMSQVMFKSDRFIIIPLHSLMPTVNQTQVFKKTPPGVRKIVIATNIAETSITIDDVVFVIDGGKIKETHFDTQNNISTMAAEWVSKANAKQRKGRAGRVQPGHCYHLYNGLRASLLDDYQLPEILRTPLEELCLQIKILKLGGIAYFLSKLMDPPSRDAVMLAINHLMELNALDRQEELTPLGVHLARLPVEPHIGKMILFGALFCCLDPVLTIAASLSFKDPFVIPLGKEKVADARRKELSKNTKSDHLTVVNAFTIYLYDCTEVSPYCLLFFGGDISIQKDKDQDTIAVDEWIVFQSPARIAHLVKNLRQELDDLLQEKIENPHPVDWNDTKSRDTAVLTAIIDLITTQENEGARNYAPRFQSERYS
ncbi:UNVERIFIED_CONTAM: hypothetical protein H355_015161 [Colinus virginianus]|nr:hypothetical protein H355_015161 [Colinus virginianus]